MAAEVPAGWYTDPANPSSERWWDGTGWTGATRDPAQRHDTATIAYGTQPLSDITGTTMPDSGNVVDGVAPQPQRTRRSVGIGLVVVLVLLVGAFGTFAFLQIWEPAADDGADPDTGASAPLPEQAPTDEQAGADGSEASEDGSSSDTEPSPEAEPDPPQIDEPEPPRLVTVTLDDQCTLTLDESVLDRSDRIRPWNHPECTWAPVTLPPGGERWIVVLASLNGDDFGPQEAQARAAALGVPGSVLWSTHYPSLNPGLWVVFSGPYPSESAAASAAQGWGSTAYPRVLSDDLGDRYCLAPDGCVGERAD